MHELGIVILRKPVSDSDCGESMSLLLWCRREVVGSNSGKLLLWLLYG